MRCSVILLASALVACGPAEPSPRSGTHLLPSAAPSVAAVTPADEVFRKTPPAPGPEVAFTPPKIDEGRLSNGARVLVVERHALPIVAIQVAFDRGASEAAPSVGAFTGAMLLAGTSTRSTVEISDAFDRLGAQYGAGVGFDMSWVWGQVTTQDTEALVDLLADVVQHPTFRKDEIERERAFRLTSVAQEQDRPATLLGNQVARALYPASHPYAFSLLGPREAVEKIDQGKLRRFYEATFVPEQATIVVAGDTSLARIVPVLERALGGWKGKARPRTPVVAPAPPGADAPRLVLVDRPGATQSQVSLALVGEKRLTPDFEAIVVMNAILGGQFSSRLNLNLREKNAYSYGVRSGFEMRHGAGPFTAGGAIFREKTDAAVKEMLGELARMRDGEVTDEELDGAKAQIVRSIPARFETLAETVSAVTGLAIYGLPLDDYAKRIERIGKVTRADVKRVASAYLSPGALRVVVVGDAAAIRPGLEALALGKLELVAAPAKKDAGGKSPGSKTGGGTAPKATPAAPTKVDDEGELRETMHN